MLVLFVNIRTESRFSFSLECWWDFYQRSKLLSIFYLVGTQQLPVMSSPICGKNINFFWLSCDGRGTDIQSQ